MELLEHEQIDNKSEKENIEVVEDGYWYIKDFAEVSNKYFQQKYPEAKPFHYNTIDNWFRDMEENKVHYVQRANERKDWRVYDQLDLKIVLFIMDKRYKANETKKVWELSAIYNILKAQFTTRSFPEDYEEKGQVTKADVENKFRELEQVFIQRFKKLEEAAKESRLLLSGQQAEVEKTAKKSFLEVLDKQSEYRKQAREEWEKQPEEVRFVRRGFFRKEERLKEREVFIEQYVENKLLRWINGDTEVEV